MVSNGHGYDLLASLEVNRSDLVGPGFGYHAVLPIPADGGPVRLWCLDEGLMLEVCEVHDGCIRVHRSGNAESGGGGIHGDAMVPRVQKPVGAVGTQVGVLGESNLASYDIGSDVVLEEAVEEGHLEVQLGPVRQEHGRPHGVGEVGQAYGIEAVAHVDDIDNLETCRVGDGDLAVALGPVPKRGVEAGLDIADGHVPDVLSAIGEEVLVGLVAALEDAELLASVNVQYVNFSGQGCWHGNLRAIRWYGHVIGPVSGNVEPPVEFASDEADGRNIAERGARYHQAETVRSRIHVVHKLIISLADSVADGHVENPTDGIGVYLPDAVILIWNNVDQSELGVGSGG